jgi:hypothetical protein
MYGWGWSGIVSTDYWQVFSQLVIDLRNEFIFLFVDGSIHPKKKKNDGKLHHCA